MGHRRREMGQLHALHRAVWGDVSHTRHLAAARSERWFHRLALVQIGTGVSAVSFGIVLLGIALVSADRQWSDVPTGAIRPTVTAPASTPSPVTTSPVTTGTTARRATTGEPSTLKVGPSSPRRSPPPPRPPLPHTGGPSRALFVLAIAFLAAGIGLARRPRLPTGSS